MASSSSSSTHLVPASISQPWEVFLSFRGEDTRKGFVDHLYEALGREGIQTYKDDKTLPRGETIRLALLEAIKGSRIAVIVFSENYADSSWCLDELTYIMDCIENKRLIGMPIFYDVDPSDVRKQKGRYAEAFTKHECENTDKVESWRKALDKAGNLSGWVPKDFANGYEAQCIKNIVTTISSMLHPLHTNVNKNLIGIETRLHDLKSKLKIGSGGVRMVGIWGVGGGGKTTLASAAYIGISHQFEACCLLENIREESNKSGLTNLQEKFLFQITKSAEAIGSETVGISMIKRKLGCKRVLVVLDDVNERKQLDALAGSHDWFGEGSRIIITTRDEHLLTRKADEIYEVSLLSHDEAIKVFNVHAYRKDKPVEDYEKLSQDVVSYAGGLPLALEILGSFLYDKDKDEWRSVLAKLKHIPYPEVTKRLKISYDGLEPDEKQLFLDITCFYRRVKIDEAMPVLHTCNFQPHIGIKVLAQKSLIKVSDEIFDMHDLVEEMAHHIVRGEHPDNPEKHSRIWEDEYIANLCDMEAVAPLMETEVLALRNRTIPFPRAFQKKKMSSWFLKPGYNRHQRLPNVIANMKKLRWIDWKSYPPSSFPSNFQPTNLGCLMLQSSWQKQLWKGYKSLPRLKILDLQLAKDLMRTPDFKGLPCLERLNLASCYKLKEIHPSIGYHESLVWVNMKECYKLKSFPPIIKMIKLETLVLSGCHRLKKFPDIQMRMDSLVNLHLDGTGIELVPPSFGQFCTNLVSFDLSKCEKLNRGFLRNLELILLTKLDLSFCNLEDGDMPSDMSGLLNLQILNLSGNEFSQLHSSLSSIPCLKFLDLSSCKSLIEIPDLPSSIAILKADGCKSLQSVGDLSNCKWLWKVSLWSSKKLIGGERVVHSMLQRNAVEDRFMSIVLPHSQLFGHWEESIALQLPDNWYNDFSGFLLSADTCFKFRFSIYMKQEMSSTDSLHPLMSSTDSKPDQWEEFGKNPEFYKGCGLMCYVPFGSLRQTSWWNPTCTHLTFQIEDLSNPKVGLVPRKSKSRERPIDCSECWEEIGDEKTFKITDYPESSVIEIEWQPKFIINALLALMKH